MVITIGSSLVIFAIVFEYTPGENKIIIKFRKTPNCGKIVKNIGWNIFLNKIDGIFSVIFAKLMKYFFCEIDEIFLSDFCEIEGRVDWDVFFWKLMKFSEKNFPVDLPSLPLNFARIVETVSRDRFG